MSDPKFRPVSRYIFTIVWVVFYLACLALTFTPGLAGEASYYLILIIGIPLTVLTAYEWSIHMPGRKRALVLVLSGVTVWVLTALLVRAGYEWRVWHTVNTVSLLFTGYTIGFWLTGELEKAGYLVPVSIIGALVDIWSVFQGPSKSIGIQVTDYVKRQIEAEALQETEHVERQLAAGTWDPPPFANFALLNFPMPGADYMTPIFGFGDLVFIALFVGGSRRFGLSIWKNILLVLTGLAVSILAAFLSGYPVPALPFICGFFLLGNFKNLELTKKEWRITLVLSIAIVFFGLINYVNKVLLGG